MTSLTNRASQTCLALAALAAIAVGLAGCDHFSGDRPDEFETGAVLLEPAQRHPILVSQKPHNLSVRVARGERGLSPMQRASIIDFLNRYKASDGGNSRLVIKVPSAAPNEIAAMNAVADMRPILADAGFAESSVTIEPYFADGDPRPPVRISFVRFIAEGPDCGKFPTNMAETARNLNYEDFGCTQQKNLAAMIANPSDLLTPRTMTPVSAERRDKTYGKYIKGDPSGATRTDDERQAIDGIEELSR